MPGWRSTFNELNDSTLKTMGWSSSRFFNDKMVEIVIIIQRFDTHDATLPETIQDFNGF